MAKRGEPGAGVDSQGHAVRDPTDNVLDLVRAETRRQDDLRGLLIDGARREADLRDQTIRREADLHDRHSEQMRLAEAARLDAIRAVDQAAVQQAALVQATAQQVLAKTVIDTAEAARTAMAAAAKAQSDSLVTTIKPILDNIAVLQQRMFEQQGQHQQTTETKVDRQSNASRGWVAAGVIAAYLSTVIGIVVVILTH